MTDQLQRFQHVPGTSPRTAILIERLKSGKPGDVVTDDELSKLAGAQTGSGKPAYANLLSAIRHCTRNHNIVWQRQAGGGYIKCLQPDEVCTRVGSDMRIIGRRARGAARIAETITPDQLTNGKRAEFSAMCAQHLMLAELSSARATKALADRKMIDAPTLPQLLENIAATKK